MKLKKKYAIKRRLDRKTNEFVFYPVHSYFGIIWDYFEEYTGDTYPLIGPFGVKTLHGIYRKVCFNNLEDAKAYIGKIILSSKTNEEIQDILIRLTEEDYK